ncbi:uncharacterized protein LOC113239134 [Hyposmocoma kahamanoa]|uniref:uncharacterized protein LOC113239134 n=1 Tax=Hyposmocoma kahamanoa TaxID=1477025 RepID=UPI000E6D5E72|nr:uncharacterized protein LOC113239134 [Hyposmocoma kahamanoa]
MSFCGICNEDVSDGVHCTSCDQVLHFHCAGLTEGGYRKLGADRKQAWKCGKCKLTGQRSPQPTGEAAIMAELKALSVKLAPLDSLTAEVKALRAEISELRAQVTLTNTSIKEFNDRCEKIEDRLAQVEGVGGRVTILEAELSKVICEANDKYQFSRMNNAEIKGIPQSQNENLLDIISSVGSKINYPINRSQINFVTRVPTKDNTQPKPIIVAFISRYVKEDFVAAARAKSREVKLNASIIGFKNMVFVNDHLTPSNKDLLTKAKKIAKDKGFLYSWVKHSKIYLRKNDTSPVIQVKSEKDLMKIV